MAVGRKVGSEAEERCKEEEGDTLKRGVTGGKV